MQHEIINLICSATHGGSPGPAPAIYESGTAAVPAAIPFLKARLVRRPTPLSPTAAIAAGAGAAPPLRRLGPRRRLGGRLRRAQPEQRAPQRLRLRRRGRRGRGEEPARRQQAAQEVEARGELVEEGERVDLLAARRRRVAPPLHGCALPGPSPEASGAAAIGQSLGRRVGRGPAAGVVGGRGGAVGEAALLERPARAAAEEATEVVALPAREGGRQRGSEALGDAAYVSGEMLGCPAVGSCTDA
jgi:hypothetical protein